MGHTGMGHLLTFARGGPVEYRAMQNATQGSISDMLSLVHM